MNSMIKFFSASLGSWLRRTWAAVLLTGRVFYFLFTRKPDPRLTLDQLMETGPASLIIALFTALVIGMIFTIQVAREFQALGAGSLVGGILALSLGRELCPIMMAIVVAGRVGSAFAAEIGTMKVTEQIDALYMLKTDPVEYLVMPRLIACCIMVPALTILALIVGLAGGLVIAQSLYGIAGSVFIDSIKTFLAVWDLICGPIKGVVFGALIAIIGCNWGLTTDGGAKGVGQSTTAAVVTTLLAIFVANFLLTWIMFQGSGQGASVIGS
ncbi:ABC transporter permease [Aphanothece hegewaldii CCALA 016]|uniref:ABC transporter permease n=2 Tax=Aphanothece TaxID=1121 RepID=A0A2T1LZP4_9CHRO|nr:MlaE family lipid ABC transporter permease subunit [Aphanothece hegewaldii]PSF37894.1 ABC transporter permease [Aphanothece hegewaldii CCALA 016]